MNSYHDMIQGVLYEHRNKAFILFTRFREGDIPVLRIMTQTPNGVVLAVDDSKVKGVFFHKAVITLTDVSGHSFQFVVNDIRGASEDTVAKCLYTAYEANILFAGHQYTPDDFWTPLSEGKMAEAMQFAGG